MSDSPITVETLVKGELSKVWKCWTEAGHVMNWNFASPDWHCPKATNDLRKGGKFSFTMAAKDGSMSFDFEGVYDEVSEQKHLTYTLADERKVSVHFEKTNEGIRVIEHFDPEKINPEEMQRAGWQAILDNFRNYVQSL